MKEAIFWQLQLRVKNMDALREIKTALCDHVSAHEPDCIAYEWGLSEDGNTLHIIEGYRTAEAAEAHIKAFQSSFVQKFFGAVAPISCTIWPGVPDTVEAVLTTIGGIKLARV